MKWNFESAPPEVTLESFTHNPFLSVVASARTCYAGQPIAIEKVREERKDPEKAKKQNEMYKSLLKAGHHTTFQHSSFTFSLDNISRLAIWSFFHTHPFYNSEQVSQRYRKMSAEDVVIPKFDNEYFSKIYKFAVNEAFAAYFKINELIHPEIQRRYFELYPKRKEVTDLKEAEAFAGEIYKKCQEVGRFILPLATIAHMKHTVNGLEMLRYYAIARQCDVPDEASFIVNAMAEEVRKIDPCFFEINGEEVVNMLGEEDGLERKIIRGLGEMGLTSNPLVFAERFDKKLGKHRSLLVSSDFNLENNFANSIRAVLGCERISDDEAISLALDPAKNPYLGHKLYLATHSPLMQTMNHVNFTFMKRINGSEDAQNQRHRMTPSSSPVLLQHITKSPDVELPYFIGLNREAKDLFYTTVRKMWHAKNELSGAKPEYALYLLPNAHNLRFYESGSLLNYYWKWAKRLCYNAQREIFLTGVDEVAQVQNKYPEIGKYIAPPCVLRNCAGINPKCPEGERYCGVPIWKEYSMKKLVENRPF